MRQNRGHTKPTIIIQSSHPNFRVIINLEITRKVTAIAIKQDNSASASSYRIVL